jgi:hypothetical protein
LTARAKPLNFKALCMANRPDPVPGMALAAAHATFQRICVASVRAGPARPDQLALKPIE